MRSSYCTVSIWIIGVLFALLGNVRAADPYGTWTRPSTGTQISLYNCGGKLCGKIVAVTDARKQNEIGTLILNGASQSGENQWKGNLLNPEDGKNYSGIVTLIGPDAVELKGCALAIFCRGETWKKVK